MRRRRVSVRRLLARSHAWIGLPPMLFALVFAVIGHFEAQRARLLDAYGIEGVAEVIDREIRVSTDSDGRSRRSYYLYVRFDAVDGGGTIEAMRSVARSRYDATAVGDRIAVYYVRHAPEIMELERGEAATMGFAFRVVSVLLVLVGLGLVTWLLRRERPLLRAARHGEVREARVISHEPVPGKGKIRRFRINWRDAAGAPGASGVHPEGRVAAVPPGSVIVVYVDPLSGAAFWDEDIGPAR